MGIPEGCHRNPMFCGCCRHLECIIPYVVSHFLAITLHHNHSKWAKTGGKHRKTNTHIASHTLSLQVVLDPDLHLHYQWHVNKPCAHFGPRACHNFPVNKNWGAPLQRLSCRNYSLLHADRLQTQSNESEDDEEEIGRLKPSKTVFCCIRPY